MTAARKYVLKLWKLLVCGSHLWTKNITHTTPVWSFFSSICCCIWMTLTMKSSLWHWVRFNLDIKTLLFFCDIAKCCNILVKPDFFPPVVMCNRVYPGPKMICPKMCLLDIWRHIDTLISKFKQWEDVHMNSPSAIAVDCSIVESWVVWVKHKYFKIKKLKNFDILPTHWNYNRCHPQIKLCLL